jgi:phosphohistidine phosphatase SixA
MTARVADARGKMRVRRPSSPSMTRELLILRHAQAEPQSPGGSDFDRPLSARGARDADAVGAWLKARDVGVDRAVTSPALRARATAERVLKALGGPTLEFEPGIYEATPGDLAALAEAALGPGRTLLVGHNPGLEQLVALLTTGRSDEFRGLPTAGLAWLTLPADGPLEPGAATLKMFWSP